jgi:hypothetical protein
MKYSLRSLMPKRHWFQFSLRTLLVVVSAVSILVGSRTAYLRWWADSHTREAARLEAQAYRGDSWEWNVRDWQEYSYHRRLADEYRTAVHFPWTRVDTNMTQGDLDLDPLKLDVLTPRKNIVP